MPHDLTQPGFFSREKEEPGTSLRIVDMLVAKILTLYGKTKLRVLKCVAVCFLGDFRTEK